MFRDYYRARGHLFGECMSNAQSDYMYIYIPKNASSWTKPNLQDLNWEFYNYHTDNLDKIALVVLRDPVERWISGIAEYFYLYHKDINIEEFTPAFIDLVFDRVAFDDHTERQSLFIEGLDHSRCIFFRCDDQYRIKFSEFLTQIGYKNQYYTYDYQHSSRLSRERTIFKDIFSKYLQNINYRNKIEDYFREDLNLINSVKFY